MLRSPYETLLAAKDRWGPVLAIGYGPVRFTYLLGRDANEMILSTRATDFTWREAFESLIPLEGDTALVVTDGEGHRRRRHLVQPAFSLRRIRGYDSIIVDEANRMLDSWRAGDHVDLHAELRSAIRRIAIRTLFGDHLGERADELGAHLQVGIDFANLPPLPGRDLNLPGLPYRRAMKARGRADAIVFDEITRRRSDDPDGPDGHGDEGDLLSALLAAQDAAGACLSDQEVRDQVVSLIAGGYETTSALVAWALYAVLADVTVQQRLRAELDADALDVEHEDIDRLVYLHAVVSETLRLHSPAGFSGRKAQADIDFAGHTIPAGSMVVYSQYVTHRDPEHWPDPTEFRPERWIGDDGTLIEVDPYTFVPFGGGYRRCIGFAMATLEAKLLIAATLRRHDLTLERQVISTTGIATVTPKGGVPVSVA